MNVPKMKINGFEGEWKRVKLAECLNISNETNKDNVYGKEDVLSVSDEIGVVNQIKHLGRSYAGKSVTNYGILKKGQIVYTKSPLKAKPFGIIKQNLGDSGIVSVLYAIYDAKEGVDAGYIHYYFDPAWRLNAYIRPLVNKGAKNTMNISDETALEGYIYLPPTLAEQQQIAEYFGQLDLLIESTGKKIASLKQTKRACLQSMFPQPGETTPRIRFKGFEGDWKCIKLSDILEERDEKSKKTTEYPLMAFIANQGVAPKGDKYDRSALVNDVENKLYKKTEYGDFIYSSNNLETGSIGLNTYGKATISPVYNIFRCKEGVNYDFIGRRLVCKDIIAEMVKWRQGVVYGQWRIHQKDFLSINILLPSNEEQRKIGEFLKNLDRQITLQEQRLEKLKQVKAACLDNMFV